ITYAKGASILKQLVAYVGIEPFKKGLRQYFEKHQWGNASFADLLGSLEAASGRELREFADTWLASAGVSKLSAEVAVDDAGKYVSAAIVQEAPAEHPTLRTHRMAVGLYDFVDGVSRRRSDEFSVDGAGGVSLVRRRRVELDVSGERTEIPQLVGEKRPDVLLLNDDDLTYCKLRLDDHSIANVVDNIAAFVDSLPRALSWAAAWDMLRDGEFAARDFVRLAVSGLPHERDINVVTMIHRQVGAALSYADRQVVDSLRASVASCARSTMLGASPGGDMQRAWARLYAAHARADDDVARLRGWLDGVDVPEGLSVDTDMRWHLVVCLSGVGAIDDAAIDAELERDNTADGERLSLIARAAIPAAEAKAEAWRRITEEPDLPNYARRSLMLGFAHPDQTDLLRPYVSRFLETVPSMWGRLATEQALEFIRFGYPGGIVEQATLDSTDDWLADESHSPAMKRGVLEGRDDVARALRARERDRRAA
ncbi:MAG: ERAP1-like C-terminal domain-containing protein, partial [Stackebrandtia sp.]